MTKAMMSIVQMTVMPVMKPMIRRRTPMMIMEVFVSVWPSGRSLPQPLLFRTGVFLPNPQGTGMVMTGG